MPLRVAGWDRVSGRRAEIGVLRASDWCVAILKNGREDGIRVIKRHRVVAQETVHDDSARKDRRA